MNHDTITVAKAAQYQGLCQQTKLHKIGMATLPKEYNNGTLTTGDNLHITIRQQFMAQHPSWVHEAKVKIKGGY